MPTIHLKGRITEKGDLDLDLPSGLPAGEALITIEIPIQPSWMPDELDRALEIAPLTGAEIVRGGFTGGWADQGISNGESWVQERRQQRRDERRGR